MNTKHLFLLTAFCSLLISCSGTTESSSETNEPTTLTSSKASCIFDYGAKYDQLLSLEVIKKHYSEDMSNAEMKYNVSKEAKGQLRDTYTYSWESDRIRKIKIGNTTMEMPIYNQIGIKWLGDDLYKIMDRENSIASFKAFYRNVSQEELDNAMKKADEQVSKSKEIGEETKNQAMDMAKGMAAGNNFETVNGVGDAASWVMKENNLVVLVGDKTFQIVADVSADSEFNKALSIKLAKEVLDFCN